MSFYIWNEGLAEVHMLADLRRIAREIELREKDPNAQRHIVVLDNEGLWTLADTHTGALYGSFNGRDDAAYICGVRNQEHSDGLKRKKNLQAFLVDL